VASVEPNGTARRRCCPPGTISPRVSHTNTRRSRRRSVSYPQYRDVSTRAPARPARPPHPSAAAAVGSVSDGASVGDRVAPLPAVPSADHVHCWPPGRRSAPLVIATDQCCERRRHGPASRGRPLGLTILRGAAREAMARCSVAAWTTLLWLASGEFPTNIFAVKINRVRSCVPHRRLALSYKQDPGAV
jgi:hypothetical protein